MLRSEYIGVAERDWRAFFSFFLYFSWVFFSYLSSSAISLRLSRPFKCLTTSS